MKIKNPKKISEATNPKFSKMLDSNKKIKSTLVKFAENPKTESPDVSIGETRMEYHMKPPSKDKENVDLVMLLLLFQLWNLESELNPTTDISHFCLQVDLWDVPDIIKDAMEDTLI